MTRFRFPSSRHPRAERRRDDLELLRALQGLFDGAEDGGLTMEEVGAFGSMLRDLEEGAPERCLTDRQRAWAETRAHDLGLSWGDPARRNANVPRGREVEMAEVLSNRPKLPPGRKP